jgi:histidyl-tRNA synthetase
MAERGMFPPGVDRPPAAVLVANFDPSAVGDTLALAAELRRGDGAALAVEVFPDADKLGRQFKYAADRGIPFVAVVGDQERQAGQVTVKTLATGTQTAVPRAEAARYIVAQLGSTRG